MAYSFHTHTLHSKEKELVLIVTVLVSSGGRAWELIAGASIDKFTWPHSPNDFDFYFANDTHKISV